MNRKLAYTLGGATVLVLAAAATFGLTLEKSATNPSSQVPSPTGGAPTPTQADRDAVLKPGQSYATARSALLAAGWLPAEYDAPSCSPYGYAPGEECHDRPEIITCSGSGRAYCAGYWIRGREVLRVVTAEGPDGSLDNFERGVTVKALLDDARESGLQLSGAAARALGVATIKVTEAWLAGNWGTTPTKNARERCESDGGVRFDRDGTYADGAGYGKYSVEGRHITYYDRVLTDAAEETEDRSKFDEPVTSTILPLTNNSMREDGETLYRCAE